LHSTTTQSEKTTIAAAGGEAAGVARSTRTQGATGEIVNPTWSDGHLGVRGGIAESENTARLIDRGVGGSVYTDDASIDSLPGHSSTALVSGPNSSWNITFGNLTIGGFNDTLTVANGGKVQSGNGTIGETLGGNSSVLVTDANSSWSVQGSLEIGFQSNASLTIANGGNLTSGTLAIGSNSNGSLTIASGSMVTTNGTYADIGGQNGANGSVVVTDAGSILNLGSATTLYVGDTGHGNLIIANGGNVSASGPAFVGTYTGSHGTLIVDGANSTLSSNNTLTMGYSGNGTMTISNGGKVLDVGITSNNITYDAADLAVTAGSTGTVLVTGANSTWINNGTITVGFNGISNLMIANGGAVYDSLPLSINNNFSDYFGLNAGANATLVVTDANSTWASNGTFVLGYNGNASMTISNGGNVNTNVAVIGEQSASNSTALVTGANSTWNTSSELYVGYNGNASLTIANGGKVVNGFGSSIGDQGGSNGTALVAGANSTWNSIAFLNVGNMGNGTLVITNGGNVTSGTGNLGINSISSGTVNIDGANSVWNAGGNLQVGYSGNGTISITNGGTLNSGSTTIGSGTGSSGMVTVSGPGSAMISNSTIAVGRLGNGTLVVANGGLVSAAFSLNMGELGLVQVNTGGTLSMGAGGEGAITLNGGTLSLPINASVYANNINLTSNSTLNQVAQSVTFGGIISGNSTLNVTGLLLSNNTLSLGASLTEFNGTIKLDDSSHGALRFNYNNSNIDFGSVNTAFDLGNSSGALANRNGNITIDLGALTGGVHTILTGASNTAGKASTYSIGALGTNTTFAGTIEDSSPIRNVAITKVGNGILTLSGTNTYTGNTTISGGTLALAATGSLASSSVINLLNGNLDVSAQNGSFTTASGQTLAGGGNFSGTANILGAATINGTLLPGSVGTVGTLAFGSNLTLNPTATSDFQINGTARGAQYSAVNVAGNLSLGGVLTVSFLNSFMPALGSSFDLFQSTNFAGVFTSVILPALNGNLSWDTSQLYTQGDITTEAINFTQWTSAAGLSGANAQPAAKPFTGGPANLIRYAMNLGTAVAPASVPQPTLTVMSGVPYLTLQYRSRKNMGDYHLVPQYSNDLVNWSNVAAGNITALPDADIYTAQFEAVAPSPPAGSVYLRVVVEHQ